MQDNLLTRHPAERGNHSRPEAIVYSGCCCLMYLHTVGAVLGAFLAGGLRRSPEEPTVYARWQQSLPWTAVFRHLPNPQWLFWSSLVFLLPFGTLLCTWLGMSLTSWVVYRSYRWSRDDRELFFTLSDHVNWDMDAMFPGVRVSDFAPVLGPALGLTMMTLSFLPLIFLPAWCLAWIRLQCRPAGSVTIGERNGLRRMLAGAFLGLLLGLATMIFLRSQGVDLIPSRPNQFRGL
ncbi:MAG: hypothetical protein ACK6D3_14065 [Planctomycetaceae bacterium]|jgi:hypothetical protein